MSRHEGVSCDNCLKGNFKGKRFKCLICYDYDLCEDCHSFGVTTEKHLSSHPMQCILTRNEFELYYRGETISPESPPSFVCPYCSKKGFTEALLREHANKEHRDTRAEVVCPVCAAQPSGDPNLVTQDLAHHLSVEHRATREAGDHVVGRHIRRMFNPGRGIRNRTHRNMHFSGGSTATSTILASAVATNSNNTSSVRDSLDPIAELLSQLSGVRRTAQELQQNVTTASQLQELQAQLQLERQRAAEIRQQLERFPNKAQSVNNNVQGVHSSVGAAFSSKTAVTSKKTNSNVDEDDSSRYLLSCLDDVTLSETEQERQREEDNVRSLFVQELLLSMISTDEQLTPESNRSPDNLLYVTERAIPVDCPRSSFNLNSSSTEYVTERAIPVDCPQSSFNLNSSSTENEDISMPIDNSSPVKTDAVKHGCIEEEKSLSPSSSSNIVGGRIESSVPDEDYNPIIASSVSECNHELNDDPSLTEVSTLASRSVPALSHRVMSETSQLHYCDRQNEDAKDSDDDKPPSPNAMQHLGLHLPGRVFASGSVRLSGAASLNEYDREEMDTGTLNKNIR